MTSIKPIKKPFAIVRFKEELQKRKRPIDLVRSGWTVVVRKCYYCKYPPTELYYLRDVWLQDGKEADDSWEMFPVDLIGTAHSLNQGKRRLERAYESMDVNSTDSQIITPPSLPRTMSKDQVRKELREMPPMTDQVAPAKRVGKSRPFSSNRGGRNKKAQADSVTRPRSSKKQESDSSRSSGENSSWSERSADASSNTSTPESKKSPKTKKNSRKLRNKQRKDNVSGLSSQPPDELENEEQNQKEIDLLRKTSSVHNVNNKKNPSSTSVSGQSKESVERAKSKNTQQDKSIRDDVPKEAEIMDNDLSPGTPPPRTSQSCFVNEDVNVTRFGADGGRDVIREQESDTDGSPGDTPSRLSLREKFKRKLFDRSATADGEQSPELPDKKKMRRALSLEIVDSIKIAIREEMRDVIKSTVSSIKIDLRNQTKDLKNTMMLNHARLSLGPPLSDLKENLTVDLPIATPEGFTEYEERLKIKAEERNALLNYMRLNISSQDLSIKECIACILGSMITKRVQLIYTGFGRDKKEDFSATQTFKLLEDAVTEKLGQKWDNKIFRACYSKWFAGAGDREGGRAQRQKRRSRSA